jgi:hypothetical protein
MWATCVIFKKMPKVNNRPLGENLLYLITLLPNDLFLKRNDLRQTNLYFAVRAILPD